MIRIDRLIISSKNFCKKIRFIINYDEFLTNSLLYFSYGIISLFILFDITDFSVVFLFFYENDEIFVLYNMIDLVKKQRATNKKSYKIR